MIGTFDFLTGTQVQRQLGSNFGPAVNVVDHRDMERARDILFQYDPYRDMSAYEIGMRVDVPLHMGCAAIIEPGIFVSWMRPKPSGEPQWPGALERLLMGLPPAYDDWFDDGPILWLVDVAAEPGVSGVEVGRRINEYMVGHGIIQDGECAAFRRHQGRRVGWAVARGGT